MTLTQYTFWNLVAGVALIVGMKLGYQHSQNLLETECIAQPGEKLIATHQSRDGVTCSYANAYGMATKQRKAKS